MKNFVNGMDVVREIGFGTDAPKGPKFLALPPGLSKLLLRRVLRYLSGKAIRLLMPLLRQVLR